MVLFHYLFYNPRERDTGHMSHWVVLYRLIGYKVPESLGAISCFYAPNTMCVTFSAIYRTDRPMLDERFAFTPPPFSHSRYMLLDVASGDSRWGTRLISSAIQFSLFIDRHQKAVSRSRCLFCAIVHC